MDENQSRLDQYGCFTSGGSEKLDGQCTLIDFQEGARRAHSMKGMDICSDLQVIDDCVMRDMIAIAQKASEAIGVYVRVDMFLGGDGQVYVQEYSTNHMNGLRHCSALKETNGCINPCFQGRMWKDTRSKGNPTFGGPKTAMPNALNDWMKLPDDSSKCSDIVTSTTIVPSTPSTCTSAPVTKSTNAPVIPPTEAPIENLSVDPSVGPSRSPSTAPTRMLVSQAPIAPTVPKCNSNLGETVSQLGTNGDVTNDPNLDVSSGVWVAAFSQLKIKSSYYPGYFSMRRFKIEQGTITVSAITDYCLQSIVVGPREFDFSNTNGHVLRYDASMKGKTIIFNVAADANNYSAVSNLKHTFDPDGNEGDSIDPNFPARVIFNFYDATEVSLGVGGSENGDFIGSVLVPKENSKLTMAYPRQFGQMIVNGEVIQDAATETEYHTYIFDTPSSGACSLPDVNTCLSS